MRQPPSLGPVPEPDGAADAQNAIDQRSLLAEIERDVRERRRDGTITAAFEAELGGAFAEVAPNDSVGGGFDEVVAQAARHAVVDYDAPTLGSAPLKLVKRTVKLLTAWYLIFVGRQLVAFAGTTLRALRLLGGRVDTLERAAPATDPRLRGVVASVTADRDDSAWHAACGEAIASTGSTGRVLHADCGAGNLVAFLHERGVDAYGTDPRVDAGTAADALGIEVRGDVVLDHLRSVDTASLRAVVLTGCVDRLTLGEKIEVLALATLTLRTDGVLVLIGEDPRAWAHAHGPIASDLAPGRAMHHTTWAHLMHRAGLASIQVAEDAPSIPEALVHHADPAIAALTNAVFHPATFCIVARRT